jgi:hypothetical protein
MYFLYTTLQIIFNDIRDIVVSPSYRAMRESLFILPDVAVVPYVYYNAIENSREMSKDIRDLAKRVLYVLQESLHT